MATATENTFSVSYAWQESKLIEEIANEVLERLDDTFQIENNDLVGVELPIKEIESLLSTTSTAVCKLGIWGIGRIGKRTIASAIFNKPLDILTVLISLKMLEKQKKMAD